MAGNDARSRGERLLAERAFRELVRSRLLPRPQALDRLNTLLRDLSSAEADGLMHERTLRSRQDAVLALGLIGMELDHRDGRASDLSVFWESAISRVKAWRSSLSRL
jgi:hypothetical protein